MLKVSLDGARDGRPFARLAVALEPSRAKRLSTIGPAPLPVQGRRGGGRGLAKGGYSTQSPGVTSAGLLLMRNSRCGKSAATWCCRSLASLILIKMAAMKSTVCWSV